MRAVTAFPRAPAGFPGVLNWDQSQGGGPCWTNDLEAVPGPANAGEADIPSGSVQRSRRGAWGGFACLQRDQSKGMVARGAVGHGSDVAVAHGVMNAGEQIECGVVTFAPRAVLGQPWRQLHHQQRLLRGHPAVGNTLDRSVLYCRGASRAAAGVSASGRWTHQLSRDGDLALQPCVLWSWSVSATFRTGRGLEAGGCRDHGPVNLIVMRAHARQVKASPAALPSAHPSGPSYSLRSGSPRQ